MTRLPMTLALALLLPAPLLAQRDLTQIPDPDPEIERKSFQVAPGFEVNLFASDPLLAKPIQMNFDAAGRLWVVSSSVYPQIKPRQKANDKILILEDTRGAGKADRVTVFADGLLIPTGLEPGDGGVYVANSTELLHLAAGKDGKAGRRRVVLSGFGTEDTHHMLHTLRWGPDGMMYFNQSVYIHSHIETPHGVRRLNGGGIWQFRPETLELAVFARGFINPWGHDFDRWGQSFATDGAGGEGINYVIPGGAYAWAVGTPRTFPGLNPGSPKYCGLEILSGRHLPEAWRGNLITNDFRGHRVCRFVLKEDGAGYASRELGELIKTNHAAFRPVDVKLGPDGALYIADWYNPIIQHGEVDFRDPRRDHVHGRIWRVTARGRPLVKRPRLAGAPTASLLEALQAPEGWTRHFAKRVLKERGAREVVPALAKWVKALDPNDAGYEHHLLEALWTYQSLDVVEPKLLASLLNARDPHARAAATRVVSAWHARLANPLELLAARVADDHPRVRLEAVRALGKLASVRAAELALHALDRPVDRFLDYGLWLTVRELQPYWLPALQEGRTALGGDVRRLIFALQAADLHGGSAAALKPLLALVKAGKVPRDREENVLALVAGLGGPRELAGVFDLVLADSTPAGRRVRLLEALTRAARERGARPAGDLGRVGALLGARDEALREAAARAAGLWRVEPLRGKLQQLALAGRTDPPLRQAALDGLVLLGGKASRDLIGRLAGADRPPEIRQMAVIALASVDPGAAARRAADLLAGKVNDPAPVVTAFLQHKGGARALAAALVGKKLPADVAKLGIRTVRASGRDNPVLTEALQKAGGLSQAGPRVLTAPEMRQLVAEVAKYGDPARGEQVFRRKEQACLRCHAIGGAGGQVGPDLSSIGASAQIDYLVESILQPNKAVKENYHALVVTTLKGRIFTGIKVRQTRTELVLRNDQDQEVAIPTREIDEVATGGSLMPEGLADTLTRAELVDLVRFLSELGKVGPYALGKARLVRRWQVLAPNAASRRLIRDSRPAAVVADPGLLWEPAYSLVSGTLPLADVPRLAGGKADGGVGFARCQLDVSTGGKVRLRLNSAEGLTLWVDRTPVELREEVVLDLPSGVHTLTFGVDFARRRAGLRCELGDVSGSRARARVVGGK